MSAEPRLSVLLFPSAYYPHVGGIEEVTRRLALNLGARGHDVLVLTNRWPDGTSPAETLDGVEVRRLPLALPGVSPGGLVRFALVGPVSAVRLARLARRFDVVHLIGAGPNAAYSAALRPLLAAPLVLTLQGEYRGDAHGSFERSVSLRFGLRRLLARADAVTACSRFVLDDLDLPVGAPAEVIPNGVEPDELGRANGARGGYVLAAGRLVPQKGFDTLLEAYAAARRELGGLRLVLAGDGPERERLEALAGDGVAFVGAVGRERLGELLRSADLFAFPSRYEGFGVALLEAMAVGVPSVAAATGGIPEFARGGESALLVPPDDPDALAGALVELAGDPDLRARLAAGGRAEAERHAWPGIVDRYEVVYRRVAG